MIEARGLSRRFGPVVALDDVSIRVEEGELVALLGPSGSGKTTLLRVLAGLEEADAGEVRVDGRDAAGLGVRERGMAFVFQQHALFRHMTVLENVAFGLRVLPRRARPSEAAIREKVRELLALVRLDGLEGRLPEQLSGGQRQRVALARALAVEPRALLLDEPFASLDARVRRDLRAWLRAVHDELHVTSVFVTHDQEEALEIADRVVVLRAGRVEQVGPPEEVLDRPRTAFVHEFFGDANALDGEVRGGAVELGGGLTARCPGRADGERVRVLVRAWDLELEPSQGDGGARVRRVSAVGDHTRIELELAGGARLTAHAPRRGAPVPAVGAAVRLRAREAHVYPAEALTPAAVAGRAEGVPEALAAEPALPGGAVG